MAAFAIKAEVADTGAARFRFAAQKTMYGGKRIAAGDTIFLFASETQGGAGLFARGVVLEVQPCPRIEGVPRQTPRVSLVVERRAGAIAALGRAELRSFRGRNEPAEGELDFKLFRQATNKIVGLSDAAARFLSSLTP